VYAIPNDSPEAKLVKSAKIGVVWHTTYTGTTFENMSASFGKPIVPSLKSTANVWMKDATYHDYSGTATFTQQETDHVTQLLSKVGTLFHKINATALNDIRNNNDFLVLLKTYNNSKIRAGQTIGNTKSHVTGLFHYIYDRLQADIDSKKTEKGKQTTANRRETILKWFAKYSQEELILIFDIAVLITQIKQLIIDKMSQASNISTFIKTTNGFKVTDPEGFCAIDHLSGGAVKLVNRMEFSRANFSADILHGWSK